MIPVLNGIFGFLVIHFVFYFVFNPKQKIHFIGIKLQGIIPAMMPAVSKASGEFANENIDFSKLLSSLKSEKSLQEISAYLDEKADHFLRKSLTEKMPVLSMFVSDKLIDQMKEVLVAELQNMIPGMIDKFGNDIGSKMDIGNMVEQKLLSIDLDKMQTQFKSKVGATILNVKLLTAMAGIVLGFMELIMLHFVSVQ